MKKLVPLVLVLSLSVASFVGCQKKQAGDMPTDPQTVDQTITDTQTQDTQNDVTDITNESTATHAGFSVNTKISGSKPASATTEGIARIDTTVVYTVAGSDGKILKSGIDGVQTEIPFDTKGQLIPKFDTSVAVPTKVEMGADYGLGKVSNIGKNWNEQSKAFSDWTIGKTPQEILAAADIPELASSVTIDVSEFKSNIDKSVSNKLLGEDITGNYKAGMGIVTGASKSKSATATESGLAQVDSVIAVVAVDESGKIIECKFDSSQAKIVFKADGTIETQLAPVVLTKQELADSYGLIKASKIGKEWYQQADALAQYCIGKTVAEVKSMKTKVVDESHPMVPDVPELTSSVTITVNDYISALEKAVATAQ